MNKILPFHYPTVTTYPNHAFILSGCTAYEQFSSFFYSGYIQLQSKNEVTKDPDSNNLLIDFYTTDIEYDHTPFIKIQRLPKMTIDKLNINIIDFIIESIEQDYYFFAFVNEQYIPGSPAYQKYYWRHMILIYGFDQDKQIFNTAGFFGGNKYSVSTASFEQVEQAYYSHDSSCIDGKDFMNHLLFYSFNKHGKYDFDIHSVHEQLQDYYYSRNTSKRHRAFRNPLKGKYGLQIYDDFKIHLDNVINGGRFKRHSFQLLWEHKRTMLERINYMVGHNYLTNSEQNYNNYSVLEKKTNILRMMMIKSLFNKDHYDIEKMIYIVDEIKDYERSALETLIESIVL
ncbi:hypothetical protein M5X04_13105 [Paenibacillus alvei]|uniref:Butirosin biosynthesis protein H N-terminal domain-containing protein n=1 Tax=Paenibacillus alvei TaxID=44250 RepID=A0ABT4ED26_PAEAL|nr:hypothetical protein [Paenibacillus alvei]MCY9530256.1 hypothetical protein [Paenibacillus alvei]